MPSIEEEMSSVDVIQGWRDVIHGWRNAIHGCHPCMEKYHPWIEMMDDGHGRSNSMVAVVKFLSVLGEI